jgi:hypothetical protein
MTKWLGLCAGAGGSPNFLLEDGSFFGVVTFFFVMIEESALEILCHGFSMKTVSPLATTTQWFILPLLENPAVAKKHLPRHC